METFMEEALVEAKKALKNGEVPVGCVFVYDNKIIARSGNLVNDTNNATRHAEFECMDLTLEYCIKNELNSNEIFPQITVLVTVEPCIMCAASLHEFGVKEIIYGCDNDRFGGKTVVDVNEIFGKEIPMTGGVRADEAMELLKEFYKGKNPSAPDNDISMTDDNMLPILINIPPISSDNAADSGNDATATDNNATATDNATSTDNNASTSGNNASTDADPVDADVIMETE